VELKLEGVKKMRNRRRFSRIETLWEARYFPKGNKRGWGKCTIIDFSSKGMGIAFHTSEEINLGSTFHLEVFVPTEADPVCVEGELRWINQRRNDFVGGIELCHINRKVLDKDKFASLS